MLGMPTYLTFTSRLVPAADIRRGASTRRAANRAADSQGVLMLALALE
jgi:hypothetical protein